MEQLTTPVYECTLPVEAHMVCDLLSQAGISARVDGEYLAGAGGELPLGNTIKVRVDPARAAEAREVIADWERQQPAVPTPPPIARGLGLKAVIWLAAGVMIGGAGMFVALRTPSSHDAVDYDGDGRNDIRYQYNGRAIARMDYDRDDDGRIDASWIFDVNGAEKEYDADNNFDGRFEWQGEVEDGEVVRNVLDADGDGNPERIERYINGVLTSAEHLAKGRVLKREQYIAGLLASAEHDVDGDGVFERRVEYDAHGEPKL
jgi:hypothetical protein